MLPLISTATREGGGSGGGDGDDDDDDDNISSKVEAGMMLRVMARNRAGREIWKIGIWFAE